MACRPRPPFLLSFHPSAFFLFFPICHVPRLGARRVRVVSGPLSAWVQVGAGGPGRAGPGAWSGRERCCASLLGWVAEGQGHVAGEGSKSWGWVLMSRVSAAALKASAGGSGSVFTRHVAPFSTLPLWSLDVKQCSLQHVVRVSQYMLDVNSAVANRESQLLPWSFCCERCFLSLLPLRAPVSGQR